MRISAAGVDFIKQWEGFEPRAYRDVAGVLTIGYGHTGGFRAGVYAEDSRIDEAEGARLLRADIAAREETVRRLIDAPLNQNEFDALVSFEFNTGGLARSTTRRLLNAGDRAGAADALLWWNKARVSGRLQTIEGLVRRREAERALFLRPARGARQRCAGTA